jgi:predicted dehydrogenase
LDKDLLRVAVVGLGKMGLLHASILNTLPNVQIVACCDKSRLILRFFRKASNKIQMVDDVEKLRDLDLDVVYVTTPIPTHVPITKILCGEKIARNIFVEKTLASSFDKAKDLCRLSQSLGGVDMVGYMKRFSVTFRKAKEVLDQSTIGKLLSFNAYAYSSDFFGVDKGLRASASRGGVLRDLGAHIVDLALWFFGDLKVESASIESPTDEGSENSVRFKARNRDGLGGFFDISWSMKNYRMPEFGLVVRASNGLMKVDDYKVELEFNNGKLLRWYRQDLADNVGFLLGEPEYFREDKYFVESVLNSCAAEPSFSTASKVDWLIGEVKNRAGKNA